MKLICVQGNDLIVHYFHPSNQIDRRWHGKVLKPEQFRKFDGPDRALVLWHYTQTVRMRIRGYSVGMSKLLRPGAPKRARFPYDERQMD